MQARERASRPGLLARRRPTRVERESFACDSGSESHPRSPDCQGAFPRSVRSIEAKGVDFQGRGKAESPVRGGMKGAKGTMGGSDYAKRGGRRQG